jgi:hypothetical protein
MQKRDHDQGASLKTRHRRRPNDLQHLPRPNSVDTGGSTRSQLRDHEAYVGDMTKSMQDALCEIAAEQADPDEAAGAHDRSQGDQVAKDPPRRGDTSRGRLALATAAGRRRDRPRVRHSHVPNGSAGAARSAALVRALRIGEGVDLYPWSERTVAVMWRTAFYELCLQ